MNEYITLPKQAKDITGQRFGRLVALGPVGQSADFQVLWLCRCDCGNKSIVKKGHLAPRRTGSCGCANKDRLRRMNTRHGMSYEPLYNTWSGIIGRCTNPKNKDYFKYGGRGISITDEWRHSYETFRSHVAKLPGFGGNGLSLDRINNDGNYEPGNVRWATPTEQIRNTRANRMITYNGETKSLAEWSDKLSIKSDTLSKRLSAGWGVNRAFTEPVRPMQRRFGRRN